MDTNTDNSSNTRRTKNGVQGWLKRKGGPLNIWSRRWCVLNDKVLFMYLREDDKKHQDAIALDRQLVSEPPVDLSDPRHGYFDITSEPQKEKNDVLRLFAECEEDKKLWMHALKRALYADKGGALFSQPLEDIVFQEKKEGRRIPYIVDECVEFLYKYGLDVEGVFRLPGRQTTIKEILAKLEQGHKINFEEQGTDVHVVASVLKHFLRELPDSLLPCAQFQKFMNFALRFIDAKSEVDKDKAVEDLTAAMKLIPEDNYVILKYVCKFLREVGLHEYENKMSMSSLGRVFGYNLIRHMDRENSQLFLCTQELSENLVFMMLHYFQQVFMLDYNDNNDPSMVVPTGDLLHMSSAPAAPSTTPTPRRPAPVRSAPSRSSHISDLAGLDLNSNPHDLKPKPRMRNSKSFHGGRDTKSNLIEIRENHFPAVNSLVTPLLRSSMNTSKASDVCGANTNETKNKDSSNTLPYKKALHVSISDGGDANSTTLPRMSKLAPPIAPRRTKSTKLTRNRRLVGGQKPEDLSPDDGLKSPRSPGGNDSVNSQDVLRALAKANKPPILSISPSASPSSTLSLDSSNSSSCEILNTVMETESLSGSSSNLIDEGVNISVGSSDGLDKTTRFFIDTEDAQIQTEEDLEIGTKFDCLNDKVETLKTELLEQKSRYKERVGALSAQLSDIQEKYEHRINTMQAESASQKQDLETKLMNEKKGMSTAGETILKLRAELHQYQMQYGDLST